MTKAKAKAQKTVSKIFISVHSFNLLLSINANDIYLNGDDERHKSTNYHEHGQLICKFSFYAKGNLYKST